MTDHDISELLDRIGERTPVASPPTAAMVADAARLRRRRTGVGVIVAAASIVAVVGGAAAVSSLGGEDDRQGNGDVAPATDGPTTTAIPDGMRLVGIRSVGIAVPEEWGTNKTRCGTPTKDTVIVDEGVVCLALVPRPADVESVKLYEGRWFEFGEEEVTINGFEQNGLSGQRIATTCAEGGQFGDEPTCRSAVYLPDQDVTFIAESSSADAREKVDQILSRIQPIPDGLVAVPGTSEILYGRNGQENSGTLYTSLLQESGLQVTIVAELRAAMTPDFILGVEPGPGTVLPAGSEVTITVTAEPRGPADEISLGINSSRADGTQGPVSLDDAKIKGNAEVRMSVGDHLWLYANGARSNTLAGELGGVALVLDDWKEGPNYGRSWIADQPGSSTITVSIQVDGERLVLGVVTVTVGQ